MCFDALTDDVGRWWNPEHSYSGVAANFSIDARAGGCFCERLKDGSVAHMTVVFVAARFACCECSADSVRFKRWPSAAA